MLISLNTTIGAAQSNVAASRATTNGVLTGGKQAELPAPFADLLTDAVGQVNQLEDQAHAAVAGMIAGSGVDVHTAMIAAEKANMAFELALAMRNKAVQAYQSVMGMQF
jgi:flagellar hook-basal body complex protein FliE